MANNNEQSNSQSSSLQGQLKKIDEQQGCLSKLEKNIKEQFKQAGENITGLISLSSAVSGIINKTKEALSELKDVNTLLNQISIADSSLSKSELEQIKNNSFSIAGKYGKSSTDYLSDFQAASGAGYKNAREIAELSAAIQSAGDITSDLANQYIFAADNAYKMNGSIRSLTETLDGANNITNKNAVDMSELAAAMSVVSSQAAASQMEINECTGQAFL